MKAARAARAVDGIIHKHLQDWNHDGARFEWEEDGARFLLSTLYTVDPATKTEIANLSIQWEGGGGLWSLPVPYTDTFGCTSATAEEVTFWVKDVVEMTLSVRELVA